ncbi:SPOR domain-containing protein [Aureibaculum marinum]|uniref:SPOR domain-containing protein n=2 Tax=Aureibaculum marinum TaxID=2487930 RepID=A0A3N4P245_9FLAO|nr:SPOR domain-containing protein [Aureibaculum marinum]
MILNNKVNVKAHNKVLNLQKQKSIMKSFLNRYSIAILTTFMFYTSFMLGQEEGNLTIESSESIKNIIAKKKAHNKNTAKVAGYRIQIFFGSEQGAYKAREEFKTLFPDTFLKIENFPPDWKVRVGNYKTRLEADRALMEIQESFTGAIVLEELIDVIREE